jgi:hypothetical protein
VRGQVRIEQHSDSAATGVSLSHTSPDHDPAKTGAAYAIGNAGIGRRSYLGERRRSGPQPNAGGLSPGAISYPQARTNANRSGIASNRQTRPDVSPPVDRAACGANLLGTNGGAFNYLMRGNRDGSFPNSD